MPGPLSCLLDCRPPTMGAWSACPAMVTVMVTCRWPSLSLVMFMVAFLWVLFRPKKVLSRPWAFPASAILAEEGF